MSPSNLLAKETHLWQCTDDIQGNYIAHGVTHAVMYTTLLVMSAGVRLAATSVVNETGFHPVCLPFWGSGIHFAVGILPSFRLDWEFK